MMNEDERLALLEAIWPKLPRNSLRSNAYYTSLVAYFNDELSRCRHHLSDISWATITEIVRQLGSLHNQSLTKAAAVARVNSVLGAGGDGGGGGDTAMQVLDLALRLMFNLDIQSARASRLLRDPDHLSFVEWDTQSTILTRVQDHFVQRKLEPLRGKSGKSEKISPSMTMAYLCNYRGLKLRWTSNLADHLAIDWRRNLIHVYEHKVSLWNHSKSNKELVIPRSTINEAIDTLNLLFPFGDKATKMLLEENGKSFNGLGNCNRDPVTRLEQFDVWKYQIAELMDVMEEEPRGLRQLQLAKDGRNLLPFVTFWVATAVALLTVISIGFGILATVYAIKQFDLAAKQYDLSVAQACSVQDAADLLPQYCS